MKQLIAIILISIIMLTGCGNKAFDKSMEEEQLPIYSNEYEKKGDSLYKKVQKKIEAIQLKKDSKIKEIIETYEDTEKVIDIGKATIDGISIRSKNSASGKYLGSLFTGDEIKILEKTSNGWYRFKYNNKYAYVGNTFIRLSGTKTIDNVLNTGVIYKTDKLTVRENYSNKSSCLGYLPKGTKVEIVRVTSTNWYKIKYENSYGYVESEYIKLIESNKKDALSIEKRKNLDNFLFVGDSFTQRIAETIKSNSKIDKVFAQGGSRPSYWLDKVDEMPDKNNVEGICVLIGVNGITQNTNIRDTKALINQLIVRYPDKKIYVQKVFPVGLNFTEGNPANHNKLIAKYNQELGEFCDTKPNVQMIDTTKGFVDKKGYLTNTLDGLHIDETMNNDFYNNIFNSIRNAEKNK